MKTLIPSNEQVAHVVARGRLHGYVEFSGRDNTYEAHAIASTDKWVQVEHSEPWLEPRSAWISDQPSPGHRLANVWLSATMVPLNTSVNHLNFGLPAEQWHLPCLDIDVPRSLLLENDLQVCSPGRILLYHPETIRWVPSSTPGHHHVYIDYPMTWYAYELMMTLLMERGVLEEGYVKASIRQGYTCVRKPECPKYEAIPPPDFEDDWPPPGQVYIDPYDED